MKWFDPTNPIDPWLGLFAVVWPIPIYGLIVLLGDMNAGNGTNTFLDFLAFTIGPGSIAYGLFILALNLILKILRLPLRLIQWLRAKFIESSNA